MKAYTIIEKKTTEEEIVDMNFPTGFTGYSSTIDGWTVTSQGFSLNGTFEGSAYNRLSQYDSYLHIYRDMPFIVSTFNVRDGGAEGSSSCMSYFDVYTVDDEGNETFIVRGSGYAERVWTNITVNCGNIETKHLKVQIHGNIGTYASAVTLLGITGQKVVPGGREYEVKHTKLTKNLKRKYYKYVDEAWQNPYLTQNGTLGTDSVACSADIETMPAYYAFRSNSPVYNEGWWANSSTFPHWITFYTEEPVKPTTFTFTNRSWGADNTKMAITQGIIQGSNDNSTWTDLKTFTNGVVGDSAIWSVDITVRDYYKYLRVYATSSSYTPAGVWISKLSISGYTKTKVVEVDESDYDFYKDVYVYNAIKSYEKGQILRRK